MRRGPDTASSDIASSDVRDGVVGRLVPAVDDGLRPDTAGDDAFCDTVDLKSQAVYRSTASPEHALM